jgi:hypothetical protein
MNSESELEDVIGIIFKPAENFYPLHPNFFLFCMNFLELVVLIS